MVGVSTAFSQIKFGIRGGINSSNMKIKDFTGDDYKLEYNTGQFGYHFGVMGQVKILSAFIQPELLFTVAKYDVKLTNTATSESEAGTQKFNKLDVPVMAGVKLGVFKLQAGPVATVMINSKSDVLDDHDDFKQKFKTATIGYQAGIGLELSSLLLDLKYEGNLSKFGDGINVGNNSFEFDQRMSQIILSLGFLF